MNNLLDLFLNNLLPIIIVIGIGFFLRQNLKLDPRNLSQLVYYILIPALLFRLLISTTINTSGVLRMMTSAFIVVITMSGLSWLIARFLQLTRSQASALILVTAFMNSGNFGLSLNQFALGEAGLAYASIFYVTSSILNNSLGVYISKNDQSSLKIALHNLIRVPAIYTIVVAGVMRGAGLALPVPIWRTIDLLGSAAVPVMLLLLGMQFGPGRIPPNWGLLGLTATLRLIISPLIALMVIPFLGLEEVAQKAAFLEAATPTAVLSGVLAVKFDLEPDYVAASILLTTILSPLTISLLLAYLSSVGFN